MSSFDRIVKWNLGLSTEERPLVAYAVAPASATVPPGEIPAQPVTWRWFLILAGVHGDEVEGIRVAQEILNGFHDESPLENLGVIIWPEANPDGTFHNQRCNGRGVDLNRNLPTNDWSSEVKNPRYHPGPFPCSEPEARALVQLIEYTNPIAIISLHSFSKPQINCNGPSQLWAEGLGALTGLPLTEDIGYPTPGCLGTFAGFERKIPTLTVEILRGQPEKDFLPTQVMMVMTAMSYWDHPLGVIPGYDCR